MTPARDALAQDLDRSPEARSAYADQLQVHHLLGVALEKSERRTLKTLEARGLYGLNKFDQNGQSYCNIIVTQVKDGKYSVVAITPSSKLWELSAAK